MTFSFVCILSNSIKQFELYQVYLVCQALTSTKRNLNIMGLSTEDDSGPKSSFPLGWHEKRITKLEGAFSDILGTLLPTVARLEEKVNGMHESLDQLKQDTVCYKEELAAVRDEIHNETTGNITRDITIGNIKEKVETRRLERSKLYWAIGKGAGMIIISVTTALLLFHFHLR